MAALAYGTKLHIHIPLVGQVDINQAHLSEQACCELLTAFEGHCPELSSHHALENTGLSVGAAGVASYVLVHTFSHLGSVQVSLFTEHRVDLEQIRRILAELFQTYHMDIQSDSRSKVISLMSERLIIGERLYALAKIDTMLIAA